MGTNSDSPDIQRIVALLARRASLEVRARSPSSDHLRVEREIESLDAALAVERAHNAALFEEARRHFLVTGEVRAATAVPAAIEEQAEIPADWDPQTRRIHARRSRRSTSRLA